jgi:UDP-2-acetamido-3-amino-2,3-dideoxy-glucuronate N-acetyltransferase
VKIGSHSFLCAGVVIGSGVFIGHGVMFCNDRYPRAITDEGVLKGPDDWLCEGVVVEDYVSIGSGAVILPGVTIRRGAMIGAGAVVVRDVMERAVVCSRPAGQIGEATR